MICAEACFLNYELLPLEQFIFAVFFFRGLHSDLSFCFLMFVLTFFLFHLDFLTLGFSFCPRLSTCRDFRELHPIGWPVNSHPFLNSHSVSTARWTWEDLKQGLKSEYETNSCTVTPATCDSEVSSFIWSSSWVRFGLFSELNEAGGYLSGAQPTSIWGHHAPADRRGDNFWQQPMNF